MERLVSTIFDSRTLTLREKDETNAILRRIRADSLFNGSHFAPLAIYRDSALYQLIHVIKGSLGNALSNNQSLCNSALEMNTGVQSRLATADRRFQKRCLYDRRCEKILRMRLRPQNGPPLPNSYILYLPIVWIPSEYVLRRS